MRSELLRLVVDDEPTEIAPDELEEEDAELKRLISFVFMAEERLTAVTSCCAFSCKMRGAYLLLK